MRLGGVLTTVLLLAAPLAAGAQGHGGMMGGRAASAPVAAAHVGPGFGHGGMGHGPGFHGPGFGHGFDHGFHDRFHDHGFLLGAYPYWGWSGCALNSDSCDWGNDGDPGAPPDGRYAYGPPPDPPAAEPPPRHAMASNECSDWVWRADLHRSVCKRGAHGAG